MLPLIFRSLFLSFFVLLLSTSTEGTEDLSSSNTQLLDDIYALLDFDEVIVDVHEIQGGFANYLWQVETLKGRYVLRYPRKIEDPEEFKRGLEISKKVFECGLTARLVGVNLEKQQTLLEFVDAIPWPSYEENNEPYIKTMKALKCFHGCLTSSFDSYSIEEWIPFSFIFKEGEKLSQNSLLPFHFSVAYQRCLRIFGSLKEWLIHHTIFCHGDFHPGNVLLKEEVDDPLLIDFDTVAPGHPFFDLAKFTVKLDSISRLHLLKIYLGREPNSVDLAHFELMDLSLLMVVATVRFHSVLNKNECFENCLIKEEMEALLNNSDQMPSFLSIPFARQSIKMRQLGALYALNEFLRRTEGEAFERLLEAAGNANGFDIKDGDFFDG